MFKLFAFIVASMVRQAWRSAVTFWYDQNTLNTAINPEMDKFHVSQLFIGMGYVVESLWNKAKTDKRIDKFEVPLHFATDSNPQGLPTLAQIKGSHGEILTKGYDTMRKMGDLAILSRTEWTDQGAGDKFIDLQGLRRDQKRDGIADTIRASMWRRTPAVPSSTTANLKINGMYDIYNEVTLHDLSSATYNIWKAYVVAATSYTGTPSTRAGLMANDTDAYLFALIDRMISYLRSRKCKPSETVISLPSGLYNLACNILELTDHRVPSAQYVTTMGYTGFSRKGFDVVEDDGMADNQTAGQDATGGLIAGIHLPSLDLYFDDANKIYNGPWKQDSDKDYWASQLIANCQLACHDRSKIAICTTLWNEKSYIPAIGSV